MNMRKLSWLVTGLLCLNVATPSGAAAQQKEKEQDQNINELIEGLFGNWNVFVMGGVTTTGRFLLQHPAIGNLGEQALTANTGWNVGGGVGGDYLLRQGYRLYYQYSKSNLTFRTNNGNGSSNLDTDPNASVHSSTLGLDLIRYLLPSRAMITPYGTLGVLGNWWGLSQRNDIVVGNVVTQPVIIGSGGSTQFNVGASVGFGLQYRAMDQFSARLEAVHSTIGNPFTGKRSFRTLVGDIIDEPTNVGRWDYHLAVVYYFEKHKEKKEPCEDNKKKK